MAATALFTMAAHPKVARRGIRHSSRRRARVSGASAGVAVLQTSRWCMLGPSRMRAALPERRSTAKRPSGPRTSWGWTSLKPTASDKRRLGPEPEELIEVAVGLVGQRPVAALAEPAHHQV